MRVKAVVLLAVVFVTAGVVAGGDAKGDLKRLQGTWSVVSAVEGGKPAPEEKIKDVQVVFDGNKITVKMGEKSMEGTFKIDPSKKPKEIDSTTGSGPDKGKTWQGIYELDGDTHKVCFAPPGKDRPKEFSSKVGSGHILQVWKREKK
jgi:uncharacterized protein (TIGR03067 family)